MTTEEKRAIMNVEEIIGALIDGLMTDGGHHKQFYLEKALSLIIGDNLITEAKANLQWEQGTE